MSTENNATAGKIYGRWECEANNTIIFISEQGRRIRFRYNGMSLYYPNADEYQCTQCPVTALMSNAQFRIVDPCAGHDCSVGAGHARWTPPTDDATATVDEHQSQATTPQASHSSSPARNAPQVIARAIYDEDGGVTWTSERYSGHLATFRLSRQCLIISGGNIVDRHPDDVGTNHGHLCQQPLLEEKLKKAKALEKAGVKSTANVAETAKGGNEDANSMPKRKVAGEPSSEFDNGRGRSLEKRPRASGADMYEDKRFGKIRDVSPSALTEAERLEWSKAQDVSTGPMRDRKLVAYKSQEHQRLFKFVRACSGPSSLDKHAFDYYCLTCWINHREECRVTVNRLKQEFVITDPDRTSSGRHACMQASSARSSRWHAAAEEPPSDGRRHICHDGNIMKLLDVDGTTCDDRGEPSRKRMRDATQRWTNGKFQSHQIYEPRSFLGHNAPARVHTQIIDGSRADMRHDHSDRSSTDQRADALTQLSRPRDLAIDQVRAERDTVTRSSEGSRQSQKLLEYPESTYSVSSAAQYTSESRPDTPHKSDVTVPTMQLVVEDEQKPQRLGGQLEAAVLEDSNNAMPSALKANGLGPRRFDDCIASTGTTERRVGSPVEVKPPRNESPEDVITIDDSEDDTNATGTSSSTCRAAKNPVKREPIEANSSEQLQEDPADRFDRFLQEFGFWNEYSNHSSKNIVKPADFIQLPHVRKKWIQFNLRN
ncbi:hypothetical protein AAVH_22700 [Aphelenchoides avenae]|nr:hypothetical protein AAVH_22700 [Aphelenchus avenae]